MSKVLVAGDPHEPACHPGYIDFLRSLRNKYKTDITVCIGDIIDNQAISFHAFNPECPGPSDEYRLAKQRINKWKRCFPNMKVCIGNHDERVIRLAESVNIPKKYLRDFKEVWNTPKWEWGFDFIIDDVYYFHGTGRGGLHPAYNVMKDVQMSVVMGHIHSAAGIDWLANPIKRTFGMNTGCGIDVDAFQFAYGKHIKRRPILAAAVVIDGVPIHHIMPCGPSERFHKSRYKNG